MHLTERPQPQRRRENTGGNMWDDSAAMYNQMAKMEKIYTLNQINSFDTDITDTVLDVGCGPGRISVPMAQRAKSVTSIDSSPVMLSYCRQNADEAGVTNLNTKLLDWNDAEVSVNLPQHDIVIASRSVGMHDIEKLCTFARKYVVLVCWANAPSIPVILNEIFSGTEEDGREPMPHMHQDRRLGYNVTYNMIYDMGYDPNIRIVTDGFTKDYECREAAYEDLQLLRPMKEAKLPVFKQNVDRLLTDNEDGTVTFKRETKTYVCWWKPVKADDYQD